MLQRLYVHNFRCLENFEFKLADIHSALLIGKNGSGKSTIARVLKIFQSIGRGANRVGQLVRPADFTLGRTRTPIRFKIEVLLRDKLFSYTLVLELPERFRELRLLEERLEVDGVAAYSRHQAQVTLPRTMPDRPEAKFNIDWHLVALPLIQDQSIADPLGEFRQWLARMVILAPIPQNITGDSLEESLEPVESASNLADWLTGLLAIYPSSYATITDHLKAVMPDISEFRNIPSGKDSKSMVVKFKSATAEFELGFDELSDGEKCSFLCAVVLAANKAYGPLFTFWDEPDNYLSLTEVGHFIIGLRRGFEAIGQILMTSHNEETIRNFSTENTFFLRRKSRLEPTVIRQLSDMPNIGGGDIVRAVIEGEIEERVAMRTLRTTSSIALSCSAHRSSPNR